MEFNSGFKGLIIALYFEIIGRYKPQQFWFIFYPNTKPLPYEASDAVVCTRSSSNLRDGLLASGNLSVSLEDPKYL